MKRNFYILLIAVSCSGSFKLCGQQPNARHGDARHQALISSVTQSVSGCGTFRTMESINYGMFEGLTGVRVKVEHPVCPGQPGAVSLVNPSGESWKYKVINKDGSAIGEGDVGYNRRIGHLEPGTYIIHFTLSDGTSAMDEFNIQPSSGLYASLEAVGGNKFTTGSDIFFKGNCNAANEYTWDFGDGSTAYGDMSVQHSYSKPGNYTVTFTAGNFDCQATATWQVIVNGSVAAGTAE